MLNDNGEEGDDDDINNSDNILYDIQDINYISSSTSNNTSTIATNKEYLGFPSLFF